MIASTNRLYKDLAWLWKLWGDPHKEYAEYSNYVMQNLQHLYPKRIESILVLGCGGGKNVFTVKKFGRTIGLDISPDMLNLAKQLNPEVDFVCADMRTFSLGSTFDAIFIDDAVSYMISEEDLSQLFTCCINHLKPGGVLSVSPDKTTENFQNNATETFRSIPHSQYPDTEIVYIVNDYDPDADDNTYETTFLYLIRQNG
ncbi:MAG: class I SAM-dependent methyltransferase, partial [Candidatus Cloacimonadaceae bacterium]|nr:class I SAM-dependent methyltransferase [Candidatus Cloacimonadaceae bacterium]